MLDETLNRYSSCSCDELGLLPGVYVEDLWMLEEGCTGRSVGGPGWICPRLDAVRRHYERLRYSSWIPFTGELERRDPPPSPIKRKDRVKTIRR